MSICLLPFFVIVRTRVRQFYEFQWNRSKGFEESDLLEELPISLRMEILISINRKSLTQITWLSPDMEGITLVDELCAVLVPAVVPQYEYLFVKGQRGSEMVILVKGVVRIIMDKGRRRTAKDGAALGDTSILFGIRHKTTAFTRTYCDLFLLSKSSLEEIVNRQGQEKMDSLRVKALEEVKKRDPGEYRELMDLLDAEDVAPNAVSGGGEKSPKQSRPDSVGSGAGRLRRTSSAFSNEEDVRLAHIDDPSNMKK
mmetsp:Transcript_26422/g.67487  ORF Transcript_26422/g.67487 Transcript_26422/m.67487 type:complete len:255 (-) Transcript_26422:400-1164(-)